MSSETPTFIHNIQKETPNMITIKIYNEPLVIPSHVPHSGKREKKDDFEPDPRSIRRTRQLIADYVLCNEFDLFCTFTFDPKKFKERFNFTSCYLRMSRWLDYQRHSHSPDLRYLVVPEKHKSGAYHFHALISHYNGLLHDSGHKNNNRPVFNISGWRVGFSTAVRIPKEDIPKVSNYVRKYITKDMSREFGRKRFLASRNLEKPIKKYNTSTFRDCLPLGRKLLYEKDTYSVYEIDPGFLQQVKKHTESYLELLLRQREEEEKRLKFSSN